MGKRTGIYGGTIFNGYERIAKFVVCGAPTITCLIDRDVKTNEIVLTFGCTETSGAAYEYDPASGYKEKYAGRYKSFSDLPDEIRETYNYKRSKYNPISIYTYFSDKAPMNI